MTTVRDVEVACDHLHQWRKEGRELPGYKPMHGKPYLALLLGLDVAEGADYTGRFMLAYNAGNHSLAEQIISPHGWAMLQVAILRWQRRIRRAAKIAAKKSARNKKRRQYREAQKEEDHYEHAQLQEP